MKITALLRPLAFALLTFAAIPASAQDDTFHLKNGDRVVFYGDSITDQRLYTLFTETYVVTRFPQLDVTFTHSGWGGDRVTGGGGGGIDTRLQRDVFAYHPTVVTVMLGMNDGRYRAFDQGIYDTYRNGMTDIAEKLEKNLPGARLTLIQPSPYDDITRDPQFPGGYNAVLVRYGEAVREIATARKANTADLNTNVVAMLEKAKATDATLAGRIIGDRIHPGDSGHLIMAGELLKSWNAPAEVATVVIDTRRREAKAARARVSELKTSPTQITWTQLDAALPMPVDMGNRETALAVNSSNFTDELNRQMLRVTGLAGDTYELLIDGQPTGVFSSAELSAGLNLATLDTPMARQAAQVHRLTRRRADTHNFRWRDIEVPLADAPEAARAGITQSIQALDAADAALRQAQRAAAQPVPRRFALQAITPAQQGVPADLPPANAGANLALGKKWTSSHPNPHGWETGLTDGVWEGRSPNVYATSESSAFPKTVTVDLESVRTLGHILIGVPGYGSTKIVEVSLSQDGEKFERIGYYSFPLRQAEKRLFNFPPTPARYIRLGYISNHAEQAGYDARFCFTTDLQAFAPAK